MIALNSKGIGDRTLNGNATHPKVDRGFSGSGFRERNTTNNPNLDVQGWAEVYLTGIPGFHIFANAAFPCSTALARS